MTWTIEDLVTSDAHTVRCRLGVSVRVADTEPDRNMFAEMFGDTAALDRVAAHFRPALQSAAQRHVAQLSADVILNAERERLQAALLEAAGPVAFACGLELLPPYSLEMESASLQRQRIEAAHRARAEERAAGQVQHLQRASELIRQFEAMRLQAPALSAGRLLEQLAPADRGAMLESLLLIAADQSQAELWAVAGVTLARIDTRKTPPTLHLFELSTEAGPLRSVQSGRIDGKRVLLVGARSGVLVVDPDALRQATVYRDDAIASQLGFSRVAIRGEEVIACHGEAGIVAWKVGSTAAPVMRHAVAAVEAAAPARSAGMTSPSLAGSSVRAARPVGARNLLVLDELFVLYSVGNELHVLRAGHDAPIALESRGEVVAILSTPPNLTIVQQDGTISLLNAATRTITDRQHRGGAICAAGLLPFLGSHRVLLASEAGPIECFGMDDPLVTQYLSPHRSLRIVTAAADRVAAVSSDRQRVILWNSWDGKSPASEVHLTAQTRHRIADIEFC